MERIIFSNQGQRNRHVELLTLGTISSIDMISLRYLCAYPFITALSPARSTFPMEAVSKDLVFERSINSSNGRDVSIAASNWYYYSECVSHEIT